MQVINVEEDTLDAFAGLIADSALEKRKTQEHSIVLGLLNDAGTPAGALSGFLFEDTFYITSLFVDPRFRANGGGKILVDALLESMVGEEIIICVEFMTEDIYTDGLASFFEAMEFRCDEEDVSVYSASANAIASDPIFTEAKYDKLEDNIQSISQIGRAALEQLNEYANYNFLPLPPGGVFAEGVDTELSVAHKNSHGVIDAYLFVDNSIEGMPTVAGIYNDADAKVLSGMLRCAMKKCRQKYPEDITLAFKPVNADSMSIMQRLAPDAERLSYKYYIFPAPAESA